MELLGSFVWREPAEPCGLLRFARAALLRALDATSAAFRRADVPAVAAATARTQPARRGSLAARKAVRIAKVPSLDVFAFILSPGDLN